MVPVHSALSGGHPAPLSAQARISAPNAACVPGAGVRRPPGVQAQPTEAVFRDVVEQCSHVLATVPRRILDLRADRAERTPLPPHGRRREAPARISRHPRGIEVRRTMAGSAP